MKHVVAVVDDDYRVLESLESLFESAGHAVHLFASAKQLLQNPCLAEIDCLISDIAMPGMDGFELSRRVRTVRPGLRVILVTGHELTDQALEMTREVHAFFHKPFDGRALLAAVCSAVKPSGQ